jgi:hypothetical protein
MRLSELSKVFYFVYVVSRLVIQRKASMSLFRTTTEMSMRVAVDLSAVTLESTAGISPIRDTARRTMPTLEINRIASDESKSKEKTEMKNATEERTVMLNKFGVVNILRTIVQAIRNQGESFANGLISYLTTYDTQRLAIENNGNLSPEGRAPSLKKLRDDYLPSMDKFIVQAEQSAASFRKNIVLMVSRAIAYKMDNAPAAEAKRIEAREQFREMNTSELSNIYLDEKTSEFLFYTILSSPLPLLSTDILKLGVENRIRRVAPDVLDYQAGIEEFLQLASSNLAAAYAYLGTTAPRQINVNVPDLVDLVSAQVGLKN